MTKVSSSRTHLKTLIIAVAALIILIVCMVPCALYWPILTYSAPVLVVYSRDTVETICRTFSVSDDDVFCSNSVTPNAETLEEMLKRRFPEGTSNYDDIVLPFETIFMPISREMLDETSEPALAFCPPTEERGAAFSCTILFSHETLSIRIHFENPSGKVIGILVPRPQRT